MFVTTFHSVETVSRALPPSKICIIIIIPTLISKPLHTGFERSVSNIGYYDVLAADFCPKHFLLSIIFKANCDQMLPPFLLRISHEAGCDEGRRGCFGMTCSRGLY
jgi:hypothetical protein